MLGNMDYTLVQGDLDTEVEFLTSDSRKAKEKTAFVCIVGAVSDGHKYIGDVVKSGASVIVVQTGFENAASAKNVQNGNEVGALDRKSVV